MTTFRITRGKANLGTVKNESRLAALLAVIPLAVLAAAEAGPVRIEEWNEARRRYEVVKPS